MEKYFILLLLISLVYFTSFGQTFSRGNTTEQAPTGYELPKSIGWVNDFEDILTTAQEQKLTDIIVEFDKKTTNQIAIVTVHDISPYENMKTYATALGNHWGVGQKDKHNGLVIVVSKNLRKVWISTGLGTEKVLTNEICKKIIDEKMIPEFRQGNSFEGLVKGLNELIGNWK